MAWTLLMYALLSLDYMVLMLQDLDDTDVCITLSLDYMISMLHGLDTTDVCITLSRLHDLDAPWPGHY
jgi:hypothetical protein